MDALAVALATTLTLPKMTRGHLFRLGWHFGLFQALMPIVGWLAGLTVQKWIAAFGHWIAFGLLGFVGLRMLLAAGPGHWSGGSGIDGRRDAGRASYRRALGSPGRGCRWLGTDLGRSQDPLAAPECWLDTRRLERCCPVLIEPTGATPMKTEFR